MNTREGRALSRRHISRRASLELLLGVCGTGCSIFLPHSWDVSHDFSDKEMRLLRQTTTVFLLRPADMARRDEFEAALERVWHLTEIEVASFERLREYADTSKYSYLVIEAEAFDKFPVPFYYLTLFIFRGTDDEPEQISYLRIDLHATPATLDLAPEDDDTGDAMMQVYRQGEFYNWSPGFLAAYLQSAQADLVRGHRRKHNADFEDSEQLERLREATLYVPDHLLLDYGIYSASRRLDPGELLGDYPYLYQIVSRDELDALIAGADKQTNPVYIFDYVLTAAAKIVSIYEYGRGAIYRDVSPVQTALSAGDFDVF